METPPVPDIEGRDIDPRDKPIVTKIDSVLVDSNDPEIERLVYNYLVGLDQDDGTE